MLNTCFLSRSQEFWYMPGRGRPHDWHPINTLGTKWLMSFLVDISHVLSQLIAGKIKYILRDSTGGTQRSLYLVSFRLYLCIFSRCWFCLCPFSEINFSYEHDSESYKCSELGGWILVLRTHDTECVILLIQKSLVAMEAKRPFWLRKAYKGGMEQVPCSWGTLASA